MAKQSKPKIKSPWPPIGPPGRAMTRREIADTLAGRVGISRKQVTKLFELQAELAYKQAKNQFPLPGIGKLVIAKSAARAMVMQFGEKKGQTAKIPAKARVKFRLSKAAKDAILGRKK
jgi:DNA-binding protein HU-beta